MSLHVDDFFYRGGEDFLKDVVENLKKRLEVRCEKKGTSNI